MDGHVHATSREEWRAWLSDNHATSSGIWLVSWRAATGRPSVPYDEAVEEALAFGWVDSRPGKVDDQRTRLWFSPRRPGSGWSRPNKERVARLEASGLMTPAGASVVARARADSSWSRLDAVEDLVVPEDLAEELGRRPPAREHWDSFPRSVRRGILEWIVSAKRPETRQRRVTETAEMAQRGERANQWRRR